MDMEPESPYDAGYHAHEDAEGRDANPFSQKTDPESWEEWGDGWDRGSSDADLRMAEYAGGGFDWPQESFEMEVVVDRRRRQATVSYEWVDYTETYYDAPEPYPDSVWITYNTASGDEGEEAIELEALSKAQQAAVLKACRENHC